MLARRFTLGCSGNSGATVGRASAWILDAMRRSDSTASIFAWVSRALWVLTLVIRYNSARAMGRDVFS